MHQLRAKIAGFLALLFLNGNLLALDIDKTQPLQVTADFVDLNQNQHKGTYKGHVAFKQGDTIIKAFQAITQADSSNQLKLAIARGNKDKQAHYWGQPDPKKPPLHAYADAIYYYPLKHLVQLKGHARVVQGENSLSAGIITYNIQTQHLQSFSQKASRTTLIFNPEKK